MTTPWYYETEVFPYQQKLCDAVRWTKYNLEGQRLKSANTLSAIRGNPLTIRLLALNDALEHFGNAKTIDKKIKEKAEEQYQKSKCFSMHGTWKAEDSSLNTKGAPIEIINIGGEQLELKYVDIQFGLYEYFTNFGSVIDRLAYEIDKLYELKIPERYLDWGKLTCKSELDKLSRKNDVLTNLLSEYQSNFYAATRYRNRLIHDGIINFEVESSFRGVLIGLGENPDDDESAFNVDAIRFCEDKRKEVLTLLNESYKLMLQDYKNCKEVS